MPTLLVDGDNLLIIGFYGAKNVFYKGVHIGGIFHFLNTLRKSFESHHLDKIVVFWDGRDGALSRRKIYQHYKENRKNRVKSEEEEEAFESQRIRVKQYLEELYVRQGEYEYCETDDCIAYYVQNSYREEKIIYSSDGDLTQLVDEKTTIYNPSHRKMYAKGDTILYNHQEVLIENVKIIKMLCGDSSDNISGIRGLGIKRLLTFFPELKTKPLTIKDIREKGDVLFEEDKNRWVIANILTGVTKHGVLGEEFFDISEQLVCLDQPILTDKAKEGIHQLIHDELDPEGRSYKNTMKMMVEDGIFTALPKSDDAWLRFLNPFLRLARKEKNKKKIKIRSHE